MTQKFNRNSRARTQFEIHFFLFYYVRVTLQIRQESVSDVTVSKFFFFFLNF